MRKFLIRLSGTAAAVLLLAPGAALAQAPSGDYTWGHQMMWGGGWYAMFLGPIFMILFLAVLVTVAVLIVRWLGGTPHHTPAARTPLDILKERFARGEIDKEEFEERRRLLGE